MFYLYKKLTNKYPYAQVLITGHSLGGALATILAAELYSKFNARIDHLYTFASPRIGNPNFH